MRQRSHSREYIHETHTLGERVADGVASLVGSWRFVIGQAALMAIWVLVNTLAILAHFDGYPFVFLNLFMSAEAAFATPIILMSQNRAAARDHLRDDHEAAEVHLLYRINRQQLALLLLWPALALFLLVRARQRKEDPR